MKEVYSPANAAEAHMLAHMLDGHGIAAHVMGEQLQGAAGDLPAGGFIKLMVADEDHARARALILEWERVQTDTTPSETFSPKRRFPIFTAWVFLSIGLLLGGVARGAFDTGYRVIASTTQTFDQDQDGVPDLTYYYSANATSANRAEGDNNFDGRPDWIMTFDPVSGATDGQRVDENFDGVFEIQMSYQNGVVDLTEIDTDGSGNPDVTLHHMHGVVVREEIIDPATQRVVRFNHYRNGLLDRAEIDLNRDGFAETLRTFDRFGEITSEETRQRPN